MTGGPTPRSPPPLTPPPLYLPPPPYPPSPPPQATLSSRPHCFCRSNICPPQNRHRPGRRPDRNPCTHQRHRRLAPRPRRVHRYPIWTSLSTHHHPTYQTRTMILPPTIYQSRISPLPPLFRPQAVVAWPPNVQPPSSLGPISDNIPQDTGNPTNLPTPPSSGPSLPPFVCPPWPTSPVPPPPPRAAPLPPPSS